MSVLLAVVTDKPSPASISGIVTEVVLTSVVIIGGVMAATLLVRGIVRGYDVVLAAFSSR